MAAELYAGRPPGGPVQAHPRIPRPLPRSCRFYEIAALGGQERLGEALELMQAYLGAYPDESGVASVLFFQGVHLEELGGEARPPTPGPGIQRGGAERGRGGRGGRTRKEATERR